MSTPTSFAVPVIDLAAGPDGMQASVAAALDRALREVGFFLLAGHGVAEQTVEAAWTAARVFFDAPAAGKDSLRMSAEYPYGYSGLAAENLARGAGAEGRADPKESFCIGPADPRAGAPPIRWPAEPPDLRPAWEAYYRAMVELADRLLGLFAVALDLPAGWFTDKTDRHASALRALNYPARAQPVPADFVRAGAHTDYGTLTILRSGGPGLQIAPRSGGWMDVPERPGCFVVNIGDLLARWTNDRWVSTPHRVVAGVAGPPLRRQSLAFFHNANTDAVVAALPGCATAENPARYPPITAGQHLMDKHRKATAGY